MGIYLDDAQGDAALLSDFLVVLSELWNTERAPTCGYTIRFTTKDVERISLFSSQIFTNEYFPSAPGPFKRAAALVLMIRTICDIQIVPLEGNDLVDCEETKSFNSYDAWVSRIAFFAIPVILNQLSIDDHGDTISLIKVWYSPTPHVKLETIMWLRWLSSAPISRFNGLYLRDNAKQTIDLERYSRALLALSLIIEQSYYLVDSTISCEIMNHGNCLVDLDDMANMDLSFDYAN